MAIQTVNIPAPAGNGSGAAVDVSSFGGLKTVTVEGNGGVFEPFVTLEMSNEVAPTKWSPIVQFTTPGESTFTIAARWIRATVSNYRGGGAPTVSLGGNTEGCTFATLIAPAGNAHGVGVDTSALPPFKTIQVGGAFRGALNIDVSEDSGATYSTVMTFSQPGQQSLVVIADFMRVSRNGVPVNSPGLPVVNIGATEDVGGGGGNTVDHDNTLVGDGTAGDPLGVNPDLTLTSLLVEALSMGPSLVPAALPAGNTNNYSPAGLDTHSLIYQATNASFSNLTGLDNTQVSDGDLRIIKNISGNDLTLVHESGLSIADNRFSLPGFKNLLIPVQGTAILEYRSASARWFSWSPAGDAFPRMYVKNFNINGEITPAALAAGVTQNWAPVDAVDATKTFQNCSAVRVVVPTGGASLGGIDATGIEIGDIRILVNHGDGSGSIGVSDLTLIERDLGSLVANRFVLPNLSTLVIPYTGAVVFRYDAPASGWIPIAISTGGRLRRIWTGALTFVSQGVVLANGSNDNFNPLDGSGNPLLAYTSYFRLTPDAGGSTITGITLQSDGSTLKTGQVLVLENAVGSVPILFVNNSGLSSAGNRFNFPNGDFKLAPKASITLVYDFVATAWVPIHNVTAFSKVTMFGKIDDLALAAAVNDYNPTNFGNTGRLRWASAGATSVSGMVAQEDGAERVMTAYGPGITLLHQSALSAAANRFFLPGAVNYAIPAGGSARAVYDSAFGGWLLTAKAA